MPATRDTQMECLCGLSYSCVWVHAPPFWDCAHQVALPCNEQTWVEGDYLLYTIISISKNWALLLCTDSSIMLCNTTHLHHGDSCTYTIVGGGHIYIPWYKHRSDMIGDGTCSQARLEASSKTPASGGRRTGGQVYSAAKGAIETVRFP